MSTDNRVLAGLSPAATAQVLAIARVVALRQNEILSQPHQPAGYVYFLTSGVVSFVVTGKEGGSTEVGMVGCEGVVGSAHLPGSYAPVATCMVQMAGSAHRVPVRDMQTLFDESAEVRGMMLQAMQQQLLSITQVSACNRLHSATQRLARWLLVTADRGRNDAVHLTQEAVSHMLGTRRTTVALVAAALQRDGLIRYARGNVEITNRAGLIRAACDCYGILQRLADTPFNNPMLRR